MCFEMDSSWPIICGAEIHVRFGLNHCKLLQAIAAYRSLSSRSFGQVLDKLQGKVVAQSVKFNGGELAWSNV